jgi:site-specific DNA-cytosine methylase
MGTTIGDLPLFDVETLNHVHVPDDMEIGMKNKHIQRGVKEEDVRNLTMKEWKGWIKQFPYSKRFQYISNDGSMKHKPGNCLLDMGGHSHVILGDSSLGTGLYRGDTHSVLTIRERARIQGCPDYFKFLPLDVKSDWKKHSLLRFQTGKYIPYQFTSYLTKQIKEFMDTGKVEQKASRKIKSNELINRAKYTFCEISGYSNQEEACKNCWINCGRYS